MRWLSYLLLALRRLVSWRSSEAFTEWKFRFLLLWLQSIPLILVLVRILDAYFLILNKYVAAALVVLPLMGLNEKILSSYRPEKYARGFDALPRAQRAAVYIAAALLVILVLSLPFIVHKIEYGHL